MTHYACVAAVARFVLTKIEDRVIFGYAAPAGGPHPCQLVLMAGETPVMVARATRFSLDAAREGVRAGWCGFELPGVAQAFAISDDVRLVCGVSSSIQAKVPLDAGLTPTTNQPQKLSVAGLLALAREAETSPSLVHLLEFATAHLRRHGARSFIERTYQTLLGRWPDASVSYELPTGRTEDEQALAYVLSLMESSEYRGRWGEQIPGPFHASFRYDRDMIG